jgi:DNA-directed RNA polymerase subunit RPC12/RpoP
MYCNTELERRVMTRHLTGCRARRAVIEQAEQREIASERLYHLFVEDAYNAEFWLHLEMRGTSTLKELDYYLRCIWLECCNHLSDFYRNDWQGSKVAKSRRIEDVVEKGSQLLHVYDYGTTSETRIKVVSVREGKPTTQHPIVLMARNRKPDYRCVQCGQLADWWCLECLLEEGEMLYLCNACGRQHSHAVDDDSPYDEDAEFLPEWLMPLVNSPRVGMCGYTGPADPPY